MRQVFATVLVEPNVLLREGLARILNTGRRFYSERIITSSLHVSRHRRGEDPDDTTKQIALFKEKHGGGRLAVLADHYQLSDVVSAFRAGANAYFSKVTTCDAFVKSLELVMLGERLCLRKSCRLFSPRNTRRTTSRLKRMHRS